MQYHFEKVTNKNSLVSLKSKWLVSLTAPQDDMWEAFTDMATHWEIKNENSTIGYACVNDENLLLQFFILPKWMQFGELIFKKFIDQEEIKKAVIGTNNPICLSIAMHLQKSVSINTYLFSDFIQTKIIKKEGDFRLAESKDLKILVNFCHNSIGAPKEWLNGYINNLITQGEFFVLERENEIIGTCEVRKSKSNLNVANIGMVVSPNHRKKGIGTYLLGKAKEKTIQWNRTPICSGEKDNIGSLKSIHNNGFRAKHQMLSMNF